VTAPSFVVRLCREFVFGGGGWLIWATILVAAFAAVGVAFSSGPLQRMVIRAAFRACLFLAALRALQTGMRSLLGWRELNLTPAGGRFICLFVATGIAAFNAGLNLLYLLFAFMGSFLVVSLILPWLMLRGISIKRSLPGLVTVGGRFDVVLRVRHRRRFPASYAVRIEDHVDAKSGTDVHAVVLLRIPCGGGSEARYAMTTSSRGRHRFGRLVVSTAFPFGLARGVMRIDVADEIISLPAPGHVTPAWEDSLGVLGVRHPDYRGRALGNEEFYSLREYRDGDNPKMIHWRTSARMRKLHVREMKGKSGRRVILVLDACSGDGADEDRREVFERAIRLLATAVVELRAGGYEFGLVLCGAPPTHLPVAEGKAHMTDALVALALTEMTDEDRFASEVDLARSAAAVLAVALDGRHEARLTRRQGVVLLNAASEGGSPLFRLRDAAPVATGQVLAPGNVWGAVG